MNKGKITVGWKYLEMLHAETIYANQTLDWAYIWVVIQYFNYYYKFIHIFTCYKQYEETAKLARKNNLKLGQPELKSLWVEI